MVQRKRQQQPVTVIKQSHATVQQVRSKVFVIRSLDNGCARRVMRAELGRGCRFGVLSLIWGLGCVLVGMGVAQGAQSEQVVSKQVVPDEQVSVVTTLSTSRSNIAANNSQSFARVEVDDESDIAQSDIIEYKAQLDPLVQEKLSWWRRLWLKGFHFVETASANELLDSSSHSFLRPQLMTSFAPLQDQAALGQVDLLASVPFKFTEDMLLPAGEKELKMVDQIHHGMSFVSYLLHMYKPTTLEYHVPLFVVDPSALTQVGHDYHFASQSPANVNASNKAIATKYGGDIQAKLKGDSERKYLNNLNIAIDGVYGMAPQAEHGAATLTQEQGTDTTATVESGYAACQGMTVIEADLKGQCQTEQYYQGMLLLSLPIAEVQREGIFNEPQMQVTPNVLQANYFAQGVDLAARLIGLNSGYEPRNTTFTGPLHSFDKHLYSTSLKGFISAGLDWSNIAKGCGQDQQDGACQLYFVGQNVNNLLRHGNEISGFNLKQQASLNVGTPYAQISNFSYDLKNKDDAVEEAKVLATTNNVLHDAKAIDSGAEDSTKSDQATNFIFGSNSSMRYLLQIPSYFVKEVLKEREQTQNNVEAKDVEHNQEHIELIEKMAGYTRVIINATAADDAQHEQEHTELIEKMANITEEIIKGKTIAKSQETNEKIDADGELAKLSAQAADGTLSEVDDSFVEILQETSEQNKTSEDKVKAIDLLQNDNKIDKKRQYVQVYDWPQDLYGIPVTFNSMGQPHLGLRNSLLSKDQYKNYPSLIEAEMAALSDLGYMIEFREFFGHSIYSMGSKDHRIGRNVQNNFALYDHASEQYDKRAPSLTPLSVGLHLYGSYNDVVHSSNVLTDGEGSMGVRVDGSENFYYQTPKSSIVVGGFGGVGLGFTYGRDNSAYISGRISALGMMGIGIKVDMGSNIYSDLVEYRGSYLRVRTLDHLLGKSTASEAAQVPLTDELNGPQVKELIVDGLVEGADAAIYIDESSFVKSINVTSKAVLKGGIYSTWNPQATGNGTIVISHDAKRGLIDGVVQYPRRPHDGFTSLEFINNYLTTNVNLGVALDEHNRIRYTDRTQRLPVGNDKSKVELDGDLSGNTFKIRHIAGKSKILGNVRANSVDVFSGILSMCSPQNFATNQVGSLRIHNDAVLDLVNGKSSHTYVQGNVVIGSNASLRVDADPDGQLLDQISWHGDISVRNYQLLVEPALPYNEIRRLSSDPKAMLQFVTNFMRAVNQRFVGNSLSVRMPKHVWDSAGNYGRELNCNARGCRIGAFTSSNVLTNAITQAQGWRYFVSFGGLVVLIIATYLYMNWPKIKDRYKARMQDKHKVASSVN